MTSILLALELGKKKIYIIENKCYVEFMKYIPASVIPEIFAAESLDKEKNSITRTMVTEQREEGSGTSRAYICWRTEKYHGKRFQEYKEVYRTKLLIYSMLIQDSIVNYGNSSYQIVKDARLDLPMNAVLYTTRDEHGYRILGLKDGTPPYYIQNVSLSLDLEKDETNLMSGLYFVNLLWWKKIKNQIPWEKNFNDYMRQCDYFEQSIGGKFPEYIARHFELKTNKFERFQRAANRGEILKAYGIQGQNPDYITIQFGAELALELEQSSKRDTLIRANQLPGNGLNYLFHFNVYEAGGKKIEENEMKGRVILKFTPDRPS